MIRAEGLTMHFGGLVALNGVSLELRPGELLSVIGPNGSGKSTLFNVLTGIYRPLKGQVYLGDRQVTGLSPTQLSMLGLARTFQNIRLFGSMTVLENVMVAARVRGKASVWSELLGLRSAKASLVEVESVARQCLAAVGLQEKADLLAPGLSYGDQKRLEIARALATDPKVLLLDEPVAGLNADERVQIAKVISSLHQSGLPIVLIEHDMRMVMEISDRIMVLHYGRSIAVGTPTEIQANPAVIAAYLGEAETEEVG